MKLFEFLNKVWECQSDNDLNALKENYKSENDFNKNDFKFIQKAFPNFEHLKCNQKKPKLENYHKHSHHTNPRIADSCATNEQYAQRAAELGHGIISIMEHGWQGRYIEGFELAKKYGLKFVFGTEAYWVKDRHEKDAKNCHIYIGARNENGRQAINEILSEANLTGFYYQARLDVDLILSLPPEDVIVTSACVAYHKYEDVEDITLKFWKHFGKNFFLEVQYHNTDKQIELNKKLIDWSNKYGISIIMGCDSHYIYPETAWERDDLLLSKNIIYEDEDGWYLDYPDGEEAVRRFKTQGVLTDQQIKEALQNTSVFMEVEDYDNPCFSNEIKMPILPNMRHLSQEERDEEFRKLIRTKWREERKSIEKEKWDYYQWQIKDEIDTVIDTKHSDYFLVNYEIIKRGVEKGGIITPSGRGCFTKDSLVKTKNGEKEICKIETGELVQSIDGNFHKVLNVQQYNINESLIEFSHMGNDGEIKFSSCTKDHKIYVYTREINKFSWKQAQNLIPYTDQVCFPIENGKFRLLDIINIKILKPQSNLVYDLEIEDLHSYVLDQMIVHNSAVSFYINKLLGFTKVDRIAASVKMYPERFMSKTRILETGSLADIDFNLGTPDIFIEAQREILGEDHSYPMLAYGTLKPKAAWKMYARSQNIDFETSNEVSKQIDKYETAYKRASTEDEKKELKVIDFIEEDFKNLFLKSEAYLGIIDSFSIHPCGFVLYTGSIRKEIGLIKIKDNICSVMDGKWAEDYSFLKNDMLKVTTSLLTARVFQRIKKQMPDVTELIKLCPPDSKVWDIYKNAWTMGINQCEQPNTRGRVGKFSPKNISELCAFVAAIRPGFKTMYKKFENREKFEYGIKVIDELIQTKEFPQSYILYQEMQMSILNYAGIPMVECYGIIKNIAKKRHDKVYAKKQQFINGFKNKMMKNEKISQEDSEKMANEIWQILEDSAFYIFNASHSYCVAVDSLYGAYLKSNFPLYFYEVFLKLLEDKGEKDRMMAVQKEAESAFKIYFPPMRFGQDNRSIVAVPENNSINMSLKSIKGFNRQISEMLYEIKDIQFKTFLDLLVHIEENYTLSTKIRELIELQYFESFGGNKALLNIFDEFKVGKNRYSKKHTEATKEKRLIALRERTSEFLDENISLQDQLKIDLEKLGKFQCTYDINPKYAFVLDIDTRYAPRVELYFLHSGKIKSLKVYKKTFSSKPFNKGDIIDCRFTQEKPATKLIDDKYVETGEINTWMTGYYLVENIKL